MLGVTKNMKIQGVREASELRAGDKFIVLSTRDYTRHDGKFCLFVCTGIKNEDGTVMATNTTFGFDDEQINRKAKVALISI